MNDNPFLKRQRIAEQLYQNRSAAGGGNSVSPRRAARRTTPEVPLSDDFDDEDDSGSVLFESLAAAPTQPPRSTGLDESNAQEQDLRDRSLNQQQHESVSSHGFGTREQTSDGFLPPSFRAAMELAADYDRAHGVMRDQISLLEGQEQEEEEQEQEVEDRGAPPTKPSAPPPAAAPPAPAPTAAAASGVSAAQRDCPACQQWFRIQFEDHQNGRRQGSSASKRVQHAQLETGNDVQEQYRRLFQIETLLRGQREDREIIQLMVAFHRERIEIPMRENGMECPVWTSSMLAEHFDVRNRHTFDKIRNLQIHLDQTRENAEAASKQCFFPDPNNPARKLINPRAVGAYEKLTKLHIAILDKMEAYQAEKGDDLASALFSVASAVRGIGMREAVVTNPRIAAGAMERGGDMRSTAKKVSGMSGTQAEFYTTSRL